MSSFIKPGDLLFQVFVVMSPVARMYVVGAIVGVIGSTLFISSVFAADAAHGATTAGANMYAGPSARYPQVMHLAGGLQVSIHGCLAGAQWCDVSWRGKRGWVQADALEVTDKGERTEVSAGVVPTATFEFAHYWDANYKTRLWYGDRAKWRQLQAQPVQAADAAGASGY